MLIRNIDICKSINYHIQNSGVLSIPAKNFYVAGDGDDKPCIITQYISASTGGMVGHFIRNRTFSIVYKVAKEGTREAIANNIDFARETIISLLGNAITLYKFTDSNQVAIDKIKPCYESDRDDIDNEKCTIVINVEY